MNETTKFSINVKSEIVKKRSFGNFWYPAHRTRACLKTNCKADNTILRPFPRTISDLPLRSIVDRPPPRRQAAVNSNDEFFRGSRYPLTGEVQPPSSLLPERGMKEQTQKLWDLGTPGFRLGVWNCRYLSLLPGPLHLLQQTRTFPILRRILLTHARSPVGGALSSIYCNWDGVILLTRKGLVQHRSWRWENKTYFRRNFTFPLTWWA